MRKKDMRPSIVIWYSVPFHAYADFETFELAHFCSVWLENKKEPALNPLRFKAGRFG